MVNKKLNSEMKLVAIRNRFSQIRLCHIVVGIAPRLKKKLSKKTISITPNRMKQLNGEIQEIIKSL